MSSDAEGFSQVKVDQAFESDSEDSKMLAKGLSGKVVEIDEVARLPTSGALAPCTPNPTQYSRPRISVAFPAAQLQLLLKIWPPSA